jgi:redox-sensing transcriptional repressor
MDSLESFVGDNPPELAVLTIPPTVTFETAERLEELGIKGIWNFTNRDLRPENSSLKVENVHFDDSLMTLCYIINESD